jgi:hypothetical protein
MELELATGECGFDQSAMAMIISVLTGIGIIVASLAITEYRYFFVRGVI